MLPFLKAEYHTLGCKLNFAETSTLGRLLQERGVMKAAPGEEPDIIVVNTCSVTEMADKKGRQLIRQLARRHPEAAIVVTGCYAQLKSEEISHLPGVAMVLGSNEKLRMTDFVEKWLSEGRHQQVAVTPLPQIREFLPSCEKGDRTRWFLKVQDGCNYYCTYCTIPIARGRSRAPLISDLMAQARQVAEEGGREIVLTGVNVGDFSNEKGETFFDLIQALDTIEGIERYRISSIEPNLLTPEIIQFVAHESRAFMPHFHIPLQAGSDEVLSLMRRRYDTALFRSRIEMIKRELPHAFIGVDIIAGAKGETPELWEKSYRFAESLPVAKFHVFPYSERPGTKALDIEYTVSQEEKHRRVAMLTALSQKKLEEFASLHTDKVRPVLWEQPKAGSHEMHGFTDNYLKVTLPLDEGLVNTVTPVLLTNDNLSTQHTD